MSKITYDVACNFDPALIDFIDQHNQTREFETLFGKLREDFFGGGRSSQILPDITSGQLEQYIKACHAKNLKFNYLMNPVCSSNREVFPETHQEMLKYIDEKVELGIDGVTVNSPLLCSVIKRRHPNLAITVGLYAWIFTLKQVEEWIDLGADVLTLGFCVTRDFTLLSAMMKLAKRSGVGLRLIANNLCLRDCTYKNSHATELAHSSQLKQKGAEFFVNYNMLQCTYNKLSKPANLIASDWIRPEDVRYYEELCHKLEFERFSIKLLDRWKTTEFLTRVVSAYATRSYEGNLLDLMSFPTEGRVKYSFEQNVNFTIKYGFNPIDMMKLGNYFKFPAVYVDNKKLDGFLEPFSKGMSCSDKVCAGSACAPKRASWLCEYCGAWAQKAISMPDEQFAEWQQNAVALLDSMKTSHMFLPVVG